MIFIQTSDGSVEDPTGKVLFFSFERFMADIVEGDCCFICGVKPGVAAFNDEHILPDWILRRYDLYDKTITLPNGTKFRYGGFKIPCCEECNRAMGRTFEEPISGFFADGAAALSRELKENGPWLLFCWMCLIFVKTHLKDKNLRLHLDAREGTDTIGDLHDWDDLHHIHCMARAFYSGCQLTKEAMGSLLVLPAKVRPHFEGFDYGDLSFAKTVVLRIEETAIVAVLNDAQAVLSIYFEELDKIKGPLSPLQVREVAAHFASINIHLAGRPSFSSDFSSGEYRILGHRPEDLRLEDWRPEIHGAIMDHTCKDMLAGVPDSENIREQVRTGRCTFLTRPDGSFQSDNMDWNSDSL